MAGLSDSERREILLEMQTMGPLDIRAKHNISNMVMSHIRWHCQHLLEGIPQPKDAVRELRLDGFTSAEAAEILKLPLSKVNALWS